MPWLRRRLRKRKLLPRKLPSNSSQKPTARVYQFKITLLGAEPAIWRRIQVTDCTLDKLHEHIQTAMGWTNSHLHRFNIQGQLYGDPRLIDDPFEDLAIVDSTRTLLSEHRPQDRPTLCFQVRV